MQSDAFGDGNSPCVGTWVGWSEGHWPGLQELGQRRWSQSWEAGGRAGPLAAVSGEARALDTQLLSARVVSNPALVQKPGLEDGVASRCP